MKPVSVVIRAFAWVCAFALVLTITACVVDEAVNFPVPERSGAGNGSGTFSDL